MICIPSGGGEKCKVAYLDYSRMIQPGTPHVRCVFVKPEDVNEYRCRYADLILVELPDRKEIQHLHEIARVGDARFWILAFARQLRLDAERRGKAAASSFFARCFMLDDDVLHLHKLHSPPESDSPCTLNEMLDVLRFGSTEQREPPPLIGFHCRRTPGSQSSMAWAADDQLGTALATALSVSTEEGVPQFHPYAELGEDVGFDQALRLETTPEGKLRFDVAALKCNLFSYKRVNSGDKHGANREATTFAADLVTKFHEVGFDPDKRIDHSGTYPLLKAIHAWSWQKVILPGEVEARFKDTHFLFTRPDDSHMSKVADASIKQGVFIWLAESDLPLSKAGVSFPDALANFHAKLRGAGLLVATKAAVDEMKEEDRAALCTSPSVASLQVPWCQDPTEYFLYKVDPPQGGFSTRRSRRNTVEPPQLTPPGGARTPTRTTAFEQNTPTTSQGSRHVKPRAGVPLDAVKAAAGSEGRDDRVLQASAIEWATAVNYLTSSLPKSAAEVVQVRERLKREADERARHEAAQQAREETQRKAQEQEVRDARRALLTLTKRAKRALNLGILETVVTLRQDYYDQLGQAIKRCMGMKHVTTLQAKETPFMIRKASHVFDQVMELQAPDTALSQELNKLKLKKQGRCDVKRVERLLSRKEGKVPCVSMKKLRDLVPQLRDLYRRQDDPELTTPALVRSLQADMHWQEERQRQRAASATEQAARRAKVAAAAEEKEKKQEMKGKRAANEEEKAYTAGVTVEEWRAQRDQERREQKADKLIAAQAKLSKDIRLKKEELKALLRDRGEPATGGYEELARRLKGSLLGGKRQRKGVGHDSEVSADEQRSDGNLSSAAPDGDGDGGSAATNDDDNGGSTTTNGEQGGGDGQPTKAQKRIYVIPRRPSVQQAQPPALAEPLPPTQPLAPTQPPLDAVAQVPKGAPSGDRGSFRFAGGGVSGGGGGGDGGGGTVSHAGSFNRGHISCAPRHNSFPCDPFPPQNGGYHEVRRDGSPPFPRHHRSRSYGSYPGGNGGSRSHGSGGHSTSGASGDTDRQWSQCDVRNGGRGRLRCDDRAEESELEEGELVEGC